MSHLIKLSVDVSKIDKSKLFQGKKGTYLDLIVSVSDEVNEHGNNVSCWEGQTREERESKANRNFLGNGRVIWTDDTSAEVPSADVMDAAEEEDDLPF